MAFLLRPDPLPRSRDSDACPVTDSGGLVGFDLETGEVRWTNIVPMASTLEQQDRATHVITPTKGDQAVDRTVNGDNGAVRRCVTRIDPSLGSARLKALDSPLTIGDVTISRGGDGVVAVDRFDRPAWKVPHVAPLAADATGLLVERRSEGKGYSIEMIDPATGKRRWRHPGRASVPLEAGAPIVIVAESKSSPTAVQVSLVDRQTGADRWTTTIRIRRNLNVEVRGIHARGFYVFNTGKGARLTAVDEVTGRVRWTADGGSPGKSRNAPDPGNVDGMVLGGSRSDTIIVLVKAFDPRDD